MSTNEKLPEIGTINLDAIACPGAEEMRNAMQAAWDNIQKDIGQHSLGFPVVIPTDKTTANEKQGDNVAALRKRVAEQEMILHDLLLEHSGYAEGFAAGVAIAKERAARLLETNGEEGNPLAKEIFHETAIAAGSNAAFAEAIRHLVVPMPAEDAPEPD